MRSFLRSVDFDKCRNVKLCKCRKSSCMDRFLKEFGKGGKMGINDFYTDKQRKTYMIPTIAVQMDMMRSAILIWVSLKKQHVLRSRIGGLRHACMDYKSWFLNFRRIWRETRRQAYTDLWSIFEFAYVSLCICV